MTFQQQYIVEVDVINNYGCFDLIQDYEYLFKKKIVANGSSTNPNETKQNEYLEGPYIIDQFALVLGILKGFINCKKNNDFLIKIQNSLKFRIYEFLYNQGYYVISGKRYGSEFLIYEDDPLVNHAKALIFFDQDLDFISMNRICTIANKNGYMVVENDKNEFKFIKFQRQLFLQ